MNAKFASSAGRGARIPRVQFLGRRKANCLVAAQTLQALTDVLAEHAVGPASRGRLARARVGVKKHSEYSEHGYFQAVETAFQQWEALQTTGRVERP